MFPQRPNRHFPLTPGAAMAQRMHGFYANFDGTVTLTDEAGNSATYTVFAGQQTVGEFRAFTAATGAINVAGGLIGLRVDLP